MRCGIAMTALVLAVSATVQAGVIVNTTLGLTNFTISPDTGTLVYQTVANGGAGITSDAYTQVFDSFGDPDIPQFNSATDGPTSATDAVPLANANIAADSSLFTTTANSQVSIPSLNADAGTVTGCCYAQIYGFFEIDSSGASTANVTFSATLSANQSLLTDAYGVSATSEVNFQLLLPDLDGSPFLSYDSPLAITGPNQTASFDATPMLSNTAVLSTNTPYYFLLETDTESYGVDSSAPEPASLLFILTGLAAIFIVRRLRQA